MANEQLFSYIRQQLKAGVSKEEITKAVLAVGWQPSDVHDAFAAVEAVTAGVPSYVPPPVMVPATFDTAQTSLIGSPSFKPITSATDSFKIAFKRFTPSLAIIGFVAIVIFGGVAYAYVQQIGPFSVSQYTEDSFLSGVISKSAQIDSASYTFSASLSVDPRDKDAVAFIVPAADPALEGEYQNDSKRMSDISSLVNGLKYKYGGQQTYNYQTGKYTVRMAPLYPNRLSIAEMKALGYGMSGTDPVTKKQYQYAATEGGRNFAITTTFETSAAVNTIRRSYGYAATTTIINGQQVTFTEGSGSYLYLPSSAPKPFFVILADSLRSISPDVSGSVAVGATTDFRKEGFPDWRFTATADGNLGDLTYKVDVEALKKDTNYYVRINKMPALPFFSFSNFKGQWIEITPTAASSTNATGFSQQNEFSALASGIANTETQYKKNRADAAEALKNLASLADTEKLIRFKTAPVGETVEGRGLYRYQLDIRKESIIPFYKALLADADKYKNLGITQDQGLLDYLQSKEFDDVVAYVQNNTYLTLWTDKQGFPAILEYRLRIVPPDTAAQLKDKQIGVIFKLVFSDINKPVTIETPAGAKPVEDIIKELNNNVSDSLTQARMKGSDAAIQSDLSIVQTESEIYYSNNGNSYGTQAWVSGAATSCKGGIFKDAVTAKALAGADTANGEGKNVVCYANGTKYLAGAELASGGWWCVDSTGTAQKETGSLPAVAPQDKVCP